MTDTLEEMRRKIRSSSKLRSVVRIMKMIAASQIKACERAADASKEYDRHVHEAFYIFFKQKNFQLPRMPDSSSFAALIFGTDQGLVGPFNDELARYVHRFLQHTKRAYLFAVGERMQIQLEEIGIKIAHTYPTPQSIQAIPPLVSTMLSDMEPLVVHERTMPFFLFYNQVTPQASYKPLHRRLLPLDEEWEQEIQSQSWSTHELPELFESEDHAINTLLREYFYSTLTTALAESMASENRSRFFAMQRAEKNIDDLLTNLRLQRNLERQNKIDSELFDVFSGYSALQ